jgi:uncharacterized membrane protein YdbT with pleckstrin-like domain
MAYPRRLIQRGENVVLDLKPHWWFFARQIVVGAGLFVFLLLVFFGLDGGVRTAGTWVWGLAALAWAVWLVKAYLDWQFTYFVVTDKRVVYRTGVLAKHGVEIPLARINNINFHQGIVDRLVGAGTLEIESAGTDGESRFSHVRHPDGVQQVIYQTMEDHERERAGWANTGAPRAAPPPVAAAAAAQAANIPEQLKQLAELRDSGVISAAEFDAKKAQLLERM